MSHLETSSVYTFDVLPLSSYLFRSILPLGPLLLFHPSTTVSTSFSLRIIRHPSFSHSARKLRCSSPTRISRSRRLLLPCADHARRGKHLLDALSLALLPVVCLASFFLRVCSQPRQSVSAAAKKLNDSRRPSLETSPRNRRTHSKRPRNWSEWRT